MFIRKVLTENGWVRGLPAADPRITSYKGIPFAAPPVGQNRWRAPQPCANWEGVYDAFDFAPIAMQDSPVIEEKNVYTREWSIDPDVVMSEDCLYLNVWVPAAVDTKNLPVFVWYFGGGLQVGHPSEMEFDGERIARRGIVVVTVNYRVNAFGFLCHPEITAESPNAPANFGHLDQQAATRWVKSNIAAFGGDPDNITIGGQSAGGGSVMNQLTSPQNKGLFQRAIVESGVAATVYPNKQRFGYIPGLAEAEQNGVNFFRFLGVQSLAEARAIDEVTLRNKVHEYHANWGTVQDNLFCIGEAIPLYCRNRRLPCPVMMGHTASEFFISPEVESVDELKAMAETSFGEDAQEFLSFIDPEHDTIEEIRKKASVSSIELAIRIAGECSAATGDDQPLYYYNFDAEIPGWDHPGTFHSVDLWFFFETLAKCWRPFTGKHYDLARQMCTYWANFIRNGNPNGEDLPGQALPQWERYAPDAPTRMLFADVSGSESCPSSPLMRFLVRQYRKKL